jgi:hypothetical protein
MAIIVNNPLKLGLNKTHQLPTHNQLTSQQPTTYKPKSVVLLPTTSLKQ